MGGKKKGVPNWTEAEDDVLREYYYHVSDKKLAEKVNLVTNRLFGGYVRTVSACLGRSGVLGLDARTQYPGHMTAQDAARQIGVGFWIVHKLVKDKQVKDVKRYRKHVYLPLSEVERLKKVDRRTDQERMADLGMFGWCAKYQAMKTLGYGESHFTRLLIAGVIKGWKSPGTGFWYVDPREIIRIEKARDGGNTHLLLDKDNPVLNEYRAKARDYLRNVRAPLRNTCPEANDRKLMAELGMDGWIIKKKAGEMMGLKQANVSVYIAQDRIKAWQSPNTKWWYVDPLEIDRVVQARADGSFYKPLGIKSHKGPRKARVLSIPSTSEDLASEIIRMREWIRHHEELLKQA